jgi:hypothetical protein
MIAAGEAFEQVVHRRQKVTGHLALPSELALMGSTGQPPAALAGIASSIENWLAFRIV